KVGGIHEATIFMFSPPTIQGFGLGSGFEVQLEDKGGHSRAEIYYVTQYCMAALNKRKEIQHTNTSYNPNFPQFQVEVNVAKCKEAGVSVSSLMSTLQGY